MSVIAVLSMTVAMYTRARFHITREKAVLVTSTSLDWPPGVVSSHHPLVGAWLAIDVPVVAQASDPIGQRVHSCRSTPFPADGGGPCHRQLAL